MSYVHENGCLDFLTPQLRRDFAVVDTDAVSNNEYDADALGLIEKHCEGVVLDCGAGRRRVYYENVINFDIVHYDTTDVRGAGEVLPFNDDVVSGFQTFWKRGTNTSSELL
jgi:hypothetical protein